ncbi:MAG: HAD hydrolase-like protein [Candidatus Moduliflexus flocculans]|nr:HAD hydrolase-like protein [Candidatus Moduliflexus flocculans]
MEPAAFDRQLNRRAAAYRKWAKEARVELNEADLWTKWMLPDWPAEPDRAAGRGVEPALARGHRDPGGLPRDGRGHPGPVPPRLPAGPGQQYHQRRRGAAPAGRNWGSPAVSETVILSCVQGMRKPDPAILLDAARRMGVDPARCAYIGDRPDRDVAAARGAGFACAVLRRNRRRLETLMSDPCPCPGSCGLLNPTRNCATLAPGSQPGRRAPSRAPACTLSRSRPCGRGKNFASLDDFFPAALRIGFNQVELNHQMNTEILSQADLSRYALSSVHEPCPADISMETLEERDWLISSTDGESAGRKGVEAVRRGIELADRLGVRQLVVHSGQVSGEMVSEKQLRRLYAADQTGSDEYRRIRDEMIAFGLPGLGRAWTRSRKACMNCSNTPPATGSALGLENRYHYNDIPTQDEMFVLLDLAGAGPARLHITMSGTPWRWTGWASSPQTAGWNVSLPAFSAPTCTMSSASWTDHQRAGSGGCGFPQDRRLPPAGCVPYDRGTSYQYARAVAEPVYKSSLKQAAFAKLKQLKIKEHYHAVPCSRNVKIFSSP